MLTAHAALVLQLFIRAFHRVRDQVGEGWGAELRHQLSELCWPGPE